jgi:pimeloyl-ACP methyl ester carboxylesterase
MTVQAVGEPFLHVVTPSVRVTAVALVLHGGRSKGTDPVPRTAGAALRMIPFARSLHRVGGREGLVVARLRYRQRGWNGPAQSPVHDARWALTQLRERFPDVPVGLVGHSMGGRTAMYVADDPAVRCVVGLAPWIEPSDPTAGLRARRVLIVHGDQDRMTSPSSSAAFAARLRGVAESVSYVVVRGEKHAMLRRAPVWHELATGFTLGVLFGKTSTGTTDAAAANVIMKALAGQPTLSV